MSYWSVKMNSENIRHQYIILGKSDMHYIRQNELLEYKYAWKTLWWGRLSDLSLIKKLRLNAPLSNCVQDAEIVIKQGFTLGKGEIVARFENKPFSFTTGIHCIKIQNSSDNLMKSICAILISSVAKYYFFLTCSGWGMWHDQIHLDELKQFPIPKLNENETIQKLSLLLDEIREYEEDTLFTQINKNKRNIKEIKEDIDEIVFDLYRLTENERDLVKDMCSYGLDLFYKKSDSYAMKKLPDIVDGFYGVASNLYEKNIQYISILKKLYLR